MKDLKSKSLPYALALAFMNAGFNEPSIFFYDNNGDWYHELIGKRNSEIKNLIPEYECAAPLLQDAIDWLREEYNLHIIVVPSNLDKGKWHYHRFNLLDDNQSSEPELIDKFDTSQEALTAALWEAIKLIPKK